MYLDNVLQNITRNLKTGENKSIQAAMDTTVVGAFYFKSITLPDNAVMIRTYSGTAHRVALSEAPVTLSSSAFVVGAIVNASEWGTFALDNGIGRTLQLTSATTCTIAVELC